MIRAFTFLAASSAVLLLLAGCAVRSDPSDGTPSASTTACHPWIEQRQGSGSNLVGHNVTGVVASSGWASSDFTVDGVPSRVNVTVTWDNPTTLEGQVRLMAEQDAAYVTLGTARGPQPLSLSVPFNGTAHGLRLRYEQPANGAGAVGAGASVETNFVSHLVISYSC